MPPAPARTSIVLAVAAACAALFAGHAFAQLPDKLPLAPDYRGEIRRGADGKLIALPVTEAGLGKLAGEVAPKATMRVGSGEKIATIGEAARLAKDGEVIEIRPGAYRGQPAVWTQDKLLIRGAGERPVMIADGRSAEDKAIWVVRGGRVRIENIEFRGARVTDGNGAGIRFEKGSLVVSRCAFLDNQNGILTANFGDAELRVEDSEFGQAPAPAPSLPHLLYVGRIARLTVVGSRFSGGREGHLLKSRARDNRILHNQLVDGPGGRASYEIDLPNGGQALVVGNVIGQSETTENLTLVSFGAEGEADPPREHVLHFVHNTVISRGLRPALFLRVHEARLARPVRQTVANNLFVGLGVPDLDWADASRGNFIVPPSVLQDADGGAWGLRPSSWLIGRAVDLPGPPGLEAWLAAQFTPPVGTRPLAPRPRWSPGAIQD